MPGSMPYQLEKGPYFSVTESVLDDIERRCWILAWLRSHPDDGFDSMPTLDSTTLQQPPGGTPINLYAHQNLHWYGQTQQSGNQFVQPPYNALTNPTTGFWHNWYGEPVKIVRETFIRAIEVSLGLPHETVEDDPGNADLIDPNVIQSRAVREWPIEVFWRCPAPWMEGWVTWRVSPYVEGDAQRHAGHVTVHFHTPSHYGSALLKSPLRAGVRPPEYAQEKPYLTSVDRDRGMWVVAQTQQDLMDHVGLPVGSHTSVEGDWELELLGVGATYKSTGDVVVVQPSEPDGGVLADGRPYVAPPTPPPIPPPPLPPIT